MNRKKDIASFQEMRGQQVEQYLDFIQNQLRGILFSRNRDVNLRQNPEGANIKEALEKRFLIKEVPIVGEPSVSTKDRIRKSILSMGRKLLVDSNPSGLPKGTPYKNYICKPKN